MRLNGAIEVEGFGCRGQVATPFAVSRRAVLAAAASALLTISGCAGGKSSKRVGSTGSTEADRSESKAAAAKGAEPDRWGEDTVAQVSALVEPYGENVSVMAVSLDASTFEPRAGEVRIMPDARRPSASIIKLFILACMLDKIAAGEAALDETLVMDVSNIVGGSGVIAAQGAGSAFTIDDLLMQMVAQSDNTAANMLIDRLGFDAVNAEAANLGCTQTVLARKMMDAQAEAEGRDNYTSAADVATLLQKLAAGAIATPELCDRARGYLLAQADTRGIAEGVPEGIAVAHKTGSLAAAQHDAAIIYAERPFILVILTQNLDRETALTLERDIATTLCTAPSSASA